MGRYEVEVVSLGKLVVTNIVCSYIYLHDATTLWERVYSGSRSSGQHVQCHAHVDVVKVSFLMKLAFPCIYVRTPFEIVAMAFPKFGSKPTSVKYLGCACTCC